MCGTYSTDLTSEGYCVESDTEKGSVQIYPAKALKLYVKPTLMKRLVKRLIKVLSKYSQ